MKKNSVVHFEIYGDNAETLAKFYTDLFDWDLQPMPGYTYIKSVDTDDKGMPTKPGGINGGMITRPHGYGVNSWVSYVNVDSVDHAVERAKSLGAKVTKPKAPVPGRGWFAMLIDPQGNNFAVWQQDANAK